MNNRDILVIGGSSGATAPLKAILSAFPADLPAAVFVVLHVPARSTGILATVASAAGRLPVSEAVDGMPIEPGRVVIATPDRHLLLTEGRIRLGRGPRENLSRPAIDPLFRSAAAAYGPRVVGLVLSGFLSDGSAGLEAIKRCGGLTLVQDPVDALVDEMPRRAIEAVLPDLVVPGAALGDVLCDLVRQPAGPTVPIPLDVRLEVDIAAGERIDSPSLLTIAEPAALTCPSCGGVLSKLRGGHPLRFRCQVGHAFSADVLGGEQEDRVDEALRVALRIIEERAELVSRMAEDGRSNGRRAVAEMYEARAQEYRGYAEALRAVVLRSLGYDAADLDA
ncbi:chemotaxis protein CheB [Methylobacterium sp. NEAU 140]|uniref:chemotaxis protein CheB n=1 Tax=Methylobacterium sp. NEAU 140 TaxID=3064945 RepID=UPI002733498A|nr:chemotaxis protein CheB [Methylobacterium sp. NEAU 140]MDP4023541.1 chemotaxis protein CheB [Methylobacterium sp. NEAU 140]